MYHIYWSTSPFQVKCSFHQPPRGTWASPRGWTRDLWGVKSRGDVGDRQSWFHCWSPPRAAPQSLAGNIIKSFCSSTTRFHTRLGRNGTRSLNYNIKEQQANKQNSPRDCFNLPPPPRTSLCRLSTPNSFCSTSPFLPLAESRPILFLICGFHAPALSYYFLFHLRPLAAC